MGAQRLFASAKTVRALVVVLIGHRPGITFPIAASSGKDLKSTLVLSQQPDTPRWKGGGGITKYVTGKRNNNNNN